MMRRVNQKMWTIHHTKSHKIQTQQDFSNLKIKEVSINSQEPRVMSAPSQEIDSISISPIINHTVYEDVLPKGHALKNDAISNDLPRISHITISERILSEDHYRAPKPSFLPRGAQHISSKPVQPSKNKGIVTGGDLPQIIQTHRKTMGRAIGALSGQGRSSKLGLLPTQLKRKNLLTGSSSNGGNKLKRQVQYKQKHANLHKTSDGYYDVRVDYDHCSRLAVVAGFKTKDVQMVLKDDNEERKTIENLERTVNCNDDSEMVDTSFDPESEDELIKTDSD